MKKQFGKNKANTIQPTLTANEQTSILFMVEEEKLAQDVYDALGDLWDLSIFNNIANSESNHGISVENLADQYAIVTPDEAEGIFVNPELQAMYDTLVAIGSQSIEDALKVGVAIETLDIEDLLEEMSVTQNTYLLSTYNKLLSASQNHLDAFSNTLIQQDDSLLPADVADWLAQETLELQLVGQTLTTIDMI